MNTGIGALARRVFVVMSIALAGHQAAQAEVVTYMGRRLVLNLPQGYCPMGPEASEQARLSVQRELTSAAGELAQFGVWCADLAEMRKGLIDRPKRWVQILIIKTQGVVRPVTAPRSAFVATVAASITSRPPDMKELERKSNEHLATKGVQMSEPMMSGLGELEGAAFFVMQSTYSNGSDSTPILTYGGLTVVNNLPLGLYAYTSSARSLDTMNTARAYVRRVHADNP